MSILSGFLVPHCPGCISCDRVPCAVPFLYLRHPPAGCGQFLPWYTISLGPNYPEDYSLALCHRCTMVHLAAGVGQLPPGSTISLDQFLWHSASPCS
jgi:hypothetical protein